MFPQWSLFDKASICEPSHTVTAIKETLEKTNLRQLKENGHHKSRTWDETRDRLDGHIVQGHVDQTGQCINKRDSNGSTYFTFTISMMLP